MKILVFSDSHGDTLNMTKVLSLHPDAKYVFHLGDGAREFNILAQNHPDMTFVGVNGNLEDYTFSKGLSDTTLDIDGRRYYLCHGHRHGVKGTTENLERYTALNDIDIALFGHTHIPCLHYHTDWGERPFYLFNPGTVGSRSAFEHTYGIIDVRGGDILFSHGKI